MLFVVIRSMDLDMAEAMTFVFKEIFKVAIQVQDTLMTYQDIIFLIRILTYLEQKHHNYRNAKFIRSYLNDII